MKHLYSMKRVPKKSGQGSGCDSESGCAKKRLMARDGIDAATADLRISAQMPLAEKVLRADFVVDNSGAPAETARQVELLCREHAISFTGSLFQ